MRVVLQRVTSGSVRVEGEVVGQIGKGLVCLVGVGRQDTEEDAEFCCRRLLVREHCAFYGSPWTMADTGLLAHGRTRACGRTARTHPGRRLC